MASPAGPADPPRRRRLIASLPIAADGVPRLRPAVRPPRSRRRPRATSTTTTTSRTTRAANTAPTMRSAHHEARMRIDWVASSCSAAWQAARGRLGVGLLPRRCRARRGYQPLGVEPSPRESATAVERFGVEVRTGFLDHVELPEDAFDLACGWHVLEHVPEPLNARHGAARRAAPGRPAVPRGAQRRQPARPQDGPRWPQLGLPEHVSIFSPASMRALLGRSGFEVSALDTVAQYSYFRPRLAWRPRVIAGRLGVSAVSRTLPHGRHPTRHEFLRVVAAPVKVAATASPVG